MKLANTPGPAKKNSQQMTMEERRQAWEAAAETAFQAARADQLAKGIGYVYERDGVVYRRMADGTEHVVSKSEAS